MLKKRRYFSIFDSSYEQNIVLWFNERWKFLFLSNFLLSILYRK